MVIGLVGIMQFVSFDTQAHDGPGATWTVSGWQYQVTDESGEERGCDIWEDIIVYSSYETGNRDIFIYNIANGTKSRITSDSSTQGKPSIFGDRIVYEDRRNGNYDIYLFNLTTWTETRITTNSADQEYPDIYGDLIVYRDERNPTFDIYMYDLSTSTEVNIGDSGYTAQQPRISDQYVVWHETSGSSYSIKAYKISFGGITYSFTSSVYSLVQPDVHGGTMVWVLGESLTDRSINYESYESYGSGLLEKTNQEQHSPSIYDGKVVWCDSDDEDILVMKDMRKGLLTIVDPSHYPKAYIRIWGDRIVYRSSHAGDYNIYYIELDRDHDGVPDSKDLFPENPMEQSDLDGDGIGDNADPDADGDGVPDLDDEFYLDPTEWSDHDNDGFGDNRDRDDDNDGIEDSRDPQPKNPLNGLDSKLDQVLLGMSEIKTDLIQRIEELESEVLNTYSDLDGSLKKNMDEDLMSVLSGLEDINENISSIDKLERTSREEISSLLEGIFENITDSESDIMEALGSGFKDLSDAVDLITETVNGIMSKDEINHTEDLEVIITLLEQLSELDIMVGEIEDLNSEVTSQKESIDSSKDSSRIFFIVIILILVILLVMAVAGLFSRPEKMEELE